MQLVPIVQYIWYGFCVCGIGFFICFVFFKKLLKIIIMFQCLEENNAVVFLKKHK